jgi:hypothetical protein
LRWISAYSCPSADDGLGIAGTAIMHSPNASLRERTLRQFAALCIVFFGGMAAWQWCLHENIATAIVLAVLALGVGLAGQIKPAVIRPVYGGWMTLTLPVRWLVSQLLVGIVFGGLITPLAIWFRLIGRDSLQRRFAPQQESYWQVRKPGPEHKSYFCQY